MKHGDKILAFLTGTLAVAAGIIKVVSTLNRDDLGCDWYCDNCGEPLNKQFGFSAGGTWTCKKCGYENDVSASNILQSRLEDDDFGREVEVFDAPAPGDWEDPEDY